MSLAAKRIPSSTAPAARPVAANGVPVLLVTIDDLLWEQFSAAVPDLRLEQHDSVADLVTAWDRERGAVVIIDARLGVDLGPALRQLSEHSRRLVPLALVDDRTAQAAVKFALAGALHGQLHDSFEPERTRAVLARGREEVAARTGRVPNPRGATLAARVPRRLALGLAVAALIAAAVISTLMLWPRPGTRPPRSATPAPHAATARAARATPPPAASASEVHGAAAGEDVEKLLGDARRAMSEKHYAEPENGSALADYRAVLAIDAANGEARQGVDRIAEVLIGRAEAALAARDVPAALRALEVARNLRPGHPRLAALDTQLTQRLRESSAAQIEAALQANAFDRVAVLLKQAERAGNVSAAQAEQLRDRMARRQAAASIANFIHLGQTRLAQGKLIAPADDSAVHYLAELGTVTDADAAAEAAKLHSDVLRRLQVEAHAAAGQAHWADAEAMLSALRSLGAPPAQVAAVESDIGQAKDQARTSATTAREAAAAAAKAAAAQAAQTASQTITRPPHLKKALAVAYPEHARAAGRQGWVDVDLTVTAAGAPENARVAAAEPAHEFEIAALSAVRRARFEPARTADGTATAATLRLHVRFALDGAQ